MLAAVAALTVVAVDPARVRWLGWAAQGDVRPLVPVIVLVALLFLPVVTKIRWGDIEIEQPAAVAPTVTEPEAAGWDAVERKIRSIAPAAVVPEPAPAVPRTALPDPLAIPVLPAP